MLPPFPTLAIVPPAPGVTVTVLVIAVQVTVAVYVTPSSPLLGESLNPPAYVPVEPLLLIETELYV